MEDREDEELYEADVEELYEARTAVTNRLQELESRVYTLETTPKSCRCTCANCSYIGEGYC